MQYRRLWTKEEVETLKRGLTEGLSNKALGEMLNRPMRQIKSRCYKLRNGISSEKFDWKTRPCTPGKRTYSKVHDKIDNPRPSDPVLAEAEYRKKLSRPSLTAEFFGDPLPGYSALDRKLARSSDA